MKFIDVLGGELVKLVTHRALMVTILISTVLTLCYCIIDSGPPSSLGLSTPETAGVYAMANFSFIAAIVGVLIASSEYEGGQIGSSVLAVPRRGRIVTAKLLVSALVSTLLGLVLAVAIATIYQVPLGDQSVYATGAASTLIVSLALAICSWTAIGVLSTCVALIIRSQTTVLAAMVLLTFGGTPLMIAHPFFQYLPMNAGVLMFIDRETQTADWIHPPDVEVPIAALTLVLWSVGAIIAASVVFARRDIGARQATVE
ncbi:hypothetical protein [Stomatohabitans albus]|uniref:hypothetical protein n=1 Tax=Stomatohabitans albus TaxID=3110766 RepID=UPI00300D4261